MHHDIRKTTSGDKLQLLEYNLSPDVVAFSTERNLSQDDTEVDAYASLNISPLYGDTPEHVRSSREKLCGKLGIDSRNILLPVQVHGKNVAVIGNDWWQLSEKKRNERLQDIDAIITRQPGLCIGVSTADCVPVLVYDPCSKTVAAIHAGWRGVVAGVVSGTFEHLREIPGFQPGQVRAVIGPSISRDAFEVGDEVYEAFSQAGFKMPDISKRIGGKWHIDLWAATYLQLLSEGVSLQGIQVSGICTYGQVDRFFSARRLGLYSGRIYNGIMLRP